MIRYSQERYVEGQEQLREGYRLIHPWAGNPRGMLGCMVTSSCKVLRPKQHSCNPAWILWRCCQPAEGRCWSWALALIASVKAATILHTAFLWLS